MAGASTLTLDAAKSLTIQRRDQVAALFPAANVADVTATSTSKSLLPCDTPDSFGWPGRATITLAGDFDHAAALEPIASKYDSSDGWTVTRGTTDKGNPTLDLDNIDGTHVHVGYFLDGTELWVDAVSPCFALPGGYVYGTQY